MSKSAGVYNSLWKSSYDYGKSYGITQCYLPSDISGEFPAFTTAKAGTGFSDPGVMQGWVELAGDIGYKVHDRRLRNWHRFGFWSAAIWHRIFLATNRTSSILVPETGRLTSFLRICHGHKDSILTAKAVLAWEREIYLAISMLPERHSPSYWQRTEELYRGKTIYNGHYTQNHNLVSMFKRYQSTHRYTYPCCRSISHPLLLLLRPTWSRWYFLDSIALYFSNYISTVFHRLITLFIIRLLYAFNEDQSINIMCRYTNHPRFPWT